MLSGAKCDYSRQFYYTDGIYIYEIKTNKRVDTLIHYIRIEGK